MELGTDDNGEVISPQTPPSFFTQDNLLVYENATAFKPYIAAEIAGDEFSPDFVVGNREMFSKVLVARRRRSPLNGIDQYYNGPLKPETSYSAFQRALVSNVSRMK